MSMVVVVSTRASTLIRRLRGVNFFKTVQQDKETHHADKDVKQKIREEACDTPEQESHTDKKL